jgi:radical SAM superfamily enzyme
MTDPVTYEWGTTRRFNAYADWFARLFGGRVQKVSINAGFTCPNRDGTLGTGGCTYCNNEAFIPAYCTPEKSVTEQIEQALPSTGADIDGLIRYCIFPGLYQHLCGYGETHGPL